MTKVFAWNLMNKVYFFIQKKVNKTSLETWVLFKSEFNIKFFINNCKLVSIKKLWLIRGLFLKIISVLNSRKLRANPGLLKSTNICKRFIKVDFILLQ